MAQSPADDGPDSGEDIPFQKSVAKANDEEEASNEEDGSEEEFTVDKIISHKTDKRTKRLEFEVSWVGWDEHSWEPIENLQETIQLEKYLRNNKDLLERVSSKKASKTQQPKETDARKRRAPEIASTPNHKAGRPAKKSRHDGVAINGNDLETNISTGGVTNWKAPAGTWEDQIVGVHTIERDEKTGELYAFIEWNNAHKSRHPNRVLHLKCPQKLLKYYEAHLFFYPNDEVNDDSMSDPKQKTDKMRAAIAASQSPIKKVAAPQSREEADVGGGEDKNEAMDETGENVKGVASAI